MSVGSAEALIDSKFDIWLDFLPSQTIFENISYWSTHSGISYRERSNYSLAAVEMPQKLKEISPMSEPLVSVGIFHTKYIDVKHRYSLNPDRSYQYLLNKLTIFLKCLTTLSHMLL